MEKSRINFVIDFATQFFSELRIAARYTELSGEWDDSFDLGLRKTILNDPTYIDRTFPEFDPYNLSKNTIAIVQDLFRCYYVIIPIPDSKTQLALFVGPFSLNQPTRNAIQQMAELLKIPDVHTAFLAQYAASLPVMHDRSCLYSFLQCVGTSLHGKKGFSIQTFTTPIPSILSYEQEDRLAKNQHTIKELEKRYQAEERLMSCVSRGDYEQALKIMDKKEVSDPEQRTIDTLRDKKNYLIVTNTLFRKAAQRAEVHPVYLDEISGKMAVRIEALHSVSQVRAMQREMIRRYCMLVRSNSTKGYSPLVQKVMNYIFVNLEDDLSLQRIASELSMNKSYLSTLFKKEMGITLTDYVNQSRIKRAIYLLNTEDMPIQEIAQRCGIPNLSYFTRIFKREKNMTPSQYREMITRKTE